MRLLPIVMLVAVCASCERKPSPGTPTSSPAVFILPFEGVDVAVLRSIQKGLSEKLIIPVTIKNEVALPANSYYEPRRRYIADSLLQFLEKYSSARFEKVIGVTASDISTRKGPHKNYGIMGYGYCPGASCVISTYRVRRTSRNEDHFHRRMLTLALHELGHTYALPHCKSSACIMKDAEGKMHLDDNLAYCANCYLHLKWKGILQ